MICNECRQCKMIELSHAWLCPACAHTIFKPGVERANIYTKNTKQSITKDKKRREGEMVQDEPKQLQEHPLQGPGSFKKTLLRTYNAIFGRDARVRKDRT